MADSELERLQAICRRQALVIDGLSKAVSMLRGGAAALKAENADLRAAHRRVDSHARAGAQAAGGVDAGDMLEVSLPLDIRAPGAARTIVARRLRGHVGAGALDSAQLLVSELVSNSVRHSDASAEEPVLVRVWLTGTMVRLEVGDSGRGGVIAPRAPDAERGAGFGLQLVQALSERWGLERVAKGGTRVWAQLPCTLVTAPAITDRPGDPVAPDVSDSNPDQRADGRRLTASPRAGGQR